MKPTAQFLGLIFAALTVTALAEDKPAQPSSAVVPPAPAAANPAPPVETLPAKSPPSVTAVTPPATPVPFSPLVKPQADDKPADPDVLELPKMVIKQKPRPRLTPEIMVTRKGYGELLAKQKFGEFDQVLNKFTLPLFGSSMAERALEEHEREKNEQLSLDVLTISKALEQVDPVEAKALREAAAKR